METVKGFQDFLGKDAEIREEIAKILIQNFKLYGFEPAETPIVEFEEFVKGNNEYDEAVSDIFRLKDKGERNLALRYELTFPLKRISQNKKLPYKRYQIGPVFRDEPTTSNRFRQFTQCDIDTIGSSIKDEAEILALANSIMKDLGIKAEIQVNSRKLLNSLIKSLGIENAEFVLREIDKVDKQGEDSVKSDLAKFIDKTTIIQLFKILRKPFTFFKKFDGFKELKELIDLTETYGFKVKFNPTIIRGLSYYNENIWEIKGDMKETITAGGSYLMNNVQSTGISFGLERLSQLAKIKLNEKKVLVISINEDERAIKLALSIRKQQVPCIIMDKISKALEYANSNNIPYVIFIGSEEVKKKKYKFKDMKSGKEEYLNSKDILERVK